jgi:radical SAM-linked protein
VKLRVRYCKLGKVRFVSHRDGARLWERALRRVSLPVAYTEGFTPRPKLSFGLALPTGAESVAEFIDIDLVDGATVDIGGASLIDALSTALPVGMDVQVIAERDTSRRSLQTEVTSTTWEMSGPGIEPELLATVAHDLLAADELLFERERKGQRRTDDIRPLINDLGPDSSGSRFVAELNTVGRSLRPSELALVAFPKIDPVDIRVLRTHQWTDHDGERREILSLPGVVSALDESLNA